MKMLHKAVVCSAMALTGFPGIAHANDDVVRGVIGLGTAIILNEMNRNRQAQQPPKAQRPRQGSSNRSVRRQPTAEELAVVESRKEVQRRLNMLGFNVGTADGIYGPRTRNAIASFQSSIGHSPSGRITEEQIAILHQQTGGSPSGPGQQGFPSFAGGGQFSQQADGAGHHSFPSLGGEAQPGQPGGGFPALGGQQEAGAGGVATSPFPALGVPGTGTGNANASAFPSLGAPVPPAPNGQQMPTIGQPEDPAQEAGFPVIGSPATPTTSNHGFPQMAQPEALPGQPAMPAISAPEESAVSMPPIETVAVEATSPDAGEPEFRTLESELGKMPFGRENQPAVLGVSLGQSLDQALLAMAEAGFADCAGAEPVSPAQCSRQTESLGDEVSISATADNEVWSVSRTIRFSSPVPMASLSNLFGETYPQMMEQTSSIKWLSSGPLCAGAMTEHDLSARVAELEDVLSRKADVMSDEVEHFANRCPLLYSLNFTEASGAVSSVVIRFVNATVIDDVRRELNEAEAESLKALTNDLKL